MYVPPLQASSKQIVKALLDKHRSSTGPSKQTSGGGGGGGGGGGEGQKKEGKPGKVETTKKGQGKEEERGGGGGGRGGGEPEKGKEVKKAAKDEGKGAKGSTSKSKVNNDRLVIL